MSEIATGGTIAAIATAVVPQQGSVGIVRVSSRSNADRSKPFHAPGRQPWETHRILYGHIVEPQTQQLVDEATVDYEGSSLHTRRCGVPLPRGIMAVQQVLQLCLEQGARLAQPGEFTLQAF